MLYGAVGSGTERHGTVGCGMAGFGRAGLGEVWKDGLTARPFLLLMQCHPRFRTGVGCKLPPQSSLQDLETMSSIDTSPRCHKS